MDYKKRNVTALVIAIVLVVLISGYFLVKENPDSKINQVISSLTGNNGDSESNSGSGIAEESSNSGASAGGSGGGGSGGSTSQSDCSLEQISYSMINLNETSVCNSYQDEICVDKTVTCSIEIYNRDSEVSGNFKVELFFLEKGGNKEEDSFDNQISDFFINPFESDSFIGSTSIQSSGEEGLANKEINCFYNTIEIPKKQVC